MTEELWNKHTAGDPMPCKCKDSRVAVMLRNGRLNVDLARIWEWGRVDHDPGFEITEWQFVRRKGEDVIAAAVP